MGGVGFVLGVFLCFLFIFFSLGEVGCFLKEFTVSGRKSE